MPSAGPDPAAFRFGVNLLSPVGRAEWQDRCRRAEDLGYDVIAVADHLGMPAPFPALVSAAAVTTRPRLAVFVLNAGFYNPALLARDLASTDQLTDGRLDAALGAGYVKAEFDAAGIPWPTARERVGHLERTVSEVRRLFDDPAHAPRPTRASVPLTIAGNGDRVLGFAARHADTVALSGAAPGSRPGKHRLLGRDELAERVRYVASHAVDRPELNLLIHAVALGGTRRDVTAGLRRFDAAPEDVPTLLVGSPARIAEDVQRLRTELGFTYLTVPEPAMESFAEVIGLLR
ncbi:TIGR03621 family F420-dependent LLM class oxidoreductase [Amycolatopsis eburnea]|uniref:TIGR03621 family F420-dependent LLM class oxidoreductase n=1 Tax=Amycolatopsis eburnea TaxID=2267691 RepID=A0A3R9EJX8_9PSEU|nr:TIGR03621 family F420-dependent LLM class oxidoreductase [Amycolatopsis eburnea]RSD10238.1 TIGR03621 family F420-dependent LLM class oxidoreductase [Amycolatopsis eburnea]